jgi:hypothetical protein
VSVESLADPSRFSLTEALEVARAAVKGAGGVDARLYDRLAQEIEKLGARPMFLYRLLELLSALDCGQRVAPFKSALLAHNDARIRSKAAVIIGRVLRNVTGIEKLLKDPDPRVQANAVEATWGLPADEFRPLLETAAQSANNRVAANALVGLYRLGDQSSIPRLFAMAEHASELFRASARWAMGETGDPRFLPWLTAAFRNDLGKGGGVVLRSLSRIRQNLAAMQQAGTLVVQPGRGRILDDSSRAFEMSVLLASRKPTGALPATSVVIREGSEQIASYECTALRTTERLLIGFAMPEIQAEASPLRMAIESGLDACLDVKRKGDLWSVVQYGPGSQGAADADEDEDEKTRPATPDDALVKEHMQNNRGLLADPLIIDKFRAGAGPARRAAPHFAACLTTVMGALARVTLPRHVFFCLDAAQRIPAGAIIGILQTARARRITMNGIVAGPEGDYADLRRLCFETGGNIRVTPIEGIADLMLTAYQSLLNRYAVSYQAGQSGPAGPPANVEVAVYSPRGCGRSAVDF